MSDQKVQIVSPDDIREVTDDDYDKRVNFIHEADQAMPKPERTHRDDCGWKHARLGTAGCLCMSKPPISVSPASLVKPQRTGETLKALVRQTITAILADVYKPSYYPVADAVARAALDRAAEIARSHRGMDGPHRSQLDCGWDMACDEIERAILAFKEGR